MVPLRLFLIVTLCFVTTNAFLLTSPRLGTKQLVPSCYSDQYIRHKLSSLSATDPLIEKFGVLVAIPPALFVGQILFLTAANLVCGLENLEEYGRLGNQYIAENRNMEQSIMKRYQIQTEGQKIWTNNVLRDLKNGGPVKPPLTSP